MTVQDVTESDIYEAADAAWFATAAAWATARAAAAAAWVVDLDTPGYVGGVTYRTVSPMSTENLYLSTRRSILNLLEAL